jgi:SAM-dependent methyltransferase
LRSEPVPGHVGHWNSVGSRAPQAGDGGLWRAYQDSINAALCLEWLPAETQGRLLKTDLFDEACGEGLCDRLSTRAGRVIGIDISHTMIGAARLHHPGLRVAEADVRRLPFRDATFDAVVSNSTLDHFERHSEIDSGLRELNRVLKPDAFLLLTLDNTANPLIGLRNFLPRRLLLRTRLTPYYVGASYGPRRTRRALVDAGFVPVRMGAVLHCPRVVLIPLARLLERVSEDTGRKIFRCLMRMESLSRWPTRYLTGCFVAALARKRSGSGQ